MTRKKLKKAYSITFTLKNKKEVIKYLKNKFKIVKAAGGVLKNKENKILFIYRLGRWDLPKGKKDKGESIKISRDKGRRIDKAKTSLTEHAVQEVHSEATRQITLHKYFITPFGMASGGGKSTQRTRMG